MKKIAQSFLRKLAVLTCLVMVTQAAVFAQSDRKVSLREKSVSVIEAIKSVGRQANMSVNYSDSQLSGKNVANLELKNASVSEALDEILKGYPALTYSIQGSYILISEKKQAPAAERTVTGTVLDETGEPMIGVNVFVDGTTVGSITDIDGKFSIVLPDGAKILNVSFIGYNTQRIVLSADKSYYDITMAMDSEALENAVVTALGIKRAEKALSYNVQQVKGDAITAVKDANFINSLNGKVAGVTINKSGSGVGGAARVVMRGAKSIEGDNNALYVIDGIPVFNTTMGNQDSGIVGEGKAGTEGIADFNPEDIESISILSGPSAAALYGSSAANGVVLITTKKGQEGKVQISFSSSTEFSKAYMTPKFQNTYGNKVGSFESWGDKLDSPSGYSPKNDFFNIGSNFINSVTLTTGNKFNQTFASLSSTNSNGIVPNNEYNRYNFTIRNTSTFLQGKIKLDLGASYVKQKDRNMVSQGRYWNPVMAAYLFPRGEDFEAIKTFERMDATRNIPVQYWPISDGSYASQNPYWTAYRNVADNDKSRYMFNAGITYTITDWLNLAVRYRMDDSHISFERRLYASTYDIFTEGSSKGFFESTNYKDRQEYADAMANINKQFGNFSLSANVGWNYSNYSALTRGYKGRLQGVANLFSLTNIDPTNGRISEDGGNSRVRNHAIFANLELGWKSMLYLTLTGRNDWNSRLVNTSEESFFYPSVGLSGIVSQMVRLPQFISFLKVRGSYTEVGAPVSRSGLTPGTVTTPIVGGSLKPTGIFPFTDFKAERTRSYEFGLSLKLWQRLSAELTYYKSNTYNQTFLGDLPESSGYKQIYLQAGNVENRGWEASLSYTDSWKDFGLTSTLTFSRNKNEIKRMVDNYRTDLSPEPISVPEVIKDGGRVILKKGGSLGDIYADTFFKKDSQGYVDIKEDGSKSMETTDPVYLGRITPDFNLGWYNQFSYKGFGLSILVNGRFGGVVTSSTQAILDRFGVSKDSAIARDNGGMTLPGQGQIDAKEYYRMTGTGEYHTSGYYCYDATNVRIQELTLSYKFPNRLFKDIVKDLTVSFIANNPWMLYCEAPYDPELTPSTGTYGQGNDYFMQPSVRSFGFGLKFKF